MEAIQAGDADGHLTEVREAEVDFRDRTSVTNALDERGDPAE